jgi:hypothetical protein
MSTATTVKHDRYRPSFKHKTQVRVLKIGDARDSRIAKILAAVPNPSGRAENQWYDIQFDDAVVERFLECHLISVDGGDGKPDAL